MKLQHIMVNSIYYRERDRGSEEIVEKGEGLDKLSDRTGKGECPDNGTCTGEPASLCRESVELDGRRRCSGTERSRWRLEDLVDVRLLEELERGDNAQGLEEASGDLETL